MGVKVNVNEMKTETMKYEVMVWHGPVDGRLLQEIGVDVSPDKISDYIDAEIWMSIPMSSVHVSILGKNSLAGCLRFLRHR